MSDQKDYEVGYGRPPKQTQFKKGVSGNPKRGPTKRTAKDQLSKALARKVRMQTERGVETITAQEAIYAALVGDALKGKGSNRKLLLEEMRHHGIGVPEVQEAIDPAGQKLLEDFIRFTEGGAATESSDG